MTTRQNRLVIALGGLALTTAPLVPANAQSGDALARAERTCLDYGIGANSAAFDACVGRVARAYERGDPTGATLAASVSGDARNACLSYGLDPLTLGYRQCVTSEIDKRSTRPYGAYYVPADDPYRPGAHAVVMIDRYGTRYDRFGNVLDRDGFVIRYAP
jgi:hypothetical protein